MKTVRVKIDPASLAVGRIDPARVDGTGEEEISAQQAADEAEAMRDSARFARRVRNRLILLDIYGELLGRDVRKCAETACG